MRVPSLCLRLYMVRGSRFLSLIYTGVVCPVALFATLNGSWFGILVVDFGRLQFLFEGHALLALTEPVPWRMGLLTPAR